MIPTLCLYDIYVQAKLNVVQSIQRFLTKYGFRCINELKLEEHTLHDDPGFVIDTIGGKNQNNNNKNKNNNSNNSKIVIIS